MVRKIPAMVSMARTEDEAQVDIPSVQDVPKYPFGLSISLCKDELDKLEMDYDDFCVGDILHLHCLALVTSVSESQTINGDPNCRVELQITNISAESEDEENEEDEEEEDKRNRLSKLYL